MAAPSVLIETAASARLVFTNPDLRRVNLALAGSLIGDLLFSTALVVYAFTAGGATTVGLYVGLRMALGAILLPPLAALVDRLPRKAFLIAMDLVRAVLVSAAALLVRVDGPLLVVLGLALLTALVGAPFRSAQVALLPVLSSEPRELTAANAIGATMESVASFVGPALAGLLLTVTEVPVLFLIDTATFVWSAVLIAGLRLTPIASDPDPAAEPAAPASFWSDATSGFRIIAADPGLRRVTMLTCLQTVIAGAATVFTVVIAADLTDFGPPGVGYLNAIIGVGAVAGGVLALGRAARHSLALDFGAGVLGWALGPVLVAVWPSPVTVVLAMVLIGIANPLVDVNVVTLIQRLTATGMIGRVFGALESAAVAGMAIGAVLMPPLIAGPGLRWALAVIGVPIIILVLINVPALRRYDRELAPPAHLQLVSELPLFAPLSPAVQDRLARALITVRVPAGRSVITAGEAGDRFYLVERGHLQAVREQEALSDMGSGDCFGEIALLRDVPRTATVVARTDVVLQALEREDFLAAVGADPEVASRADLLVSGRLAR